MIGAAGGGARTVSWAAAREERQMKRMVLVETMLGVYVGGRQGLTGESVLLRTCVH